MVSVSPRAMPPGSLTWLGRVWGLIPNWAWDTRNSRGRDSFGNPGFPGRAGKIHALSWRKIISQSWDWIHIPNWEPVWSVFSVQRGSEFRGPSISKSPPQDTWEAHIHTCHTWYPQKAATMKRWEVITHNNNHQSFLHFQSLQKYLSAERPDWNGVRAGLFHHVSWLTREPLPSEVWEVISVPTLSLAQVLTPFLVTEEFPETRPLWGHTSQAAVRWLSFQEPFLHPTSFPLLPLLWMRTSPMVRLSLPLVLWVLWASAPPASGACCLDTHLWDTRGQNSGLVNWQKSSAVHWGLPSTPPPRPTTTSV